MNTPPKGMDPQALSYWIEVEKDRRFVWREGAYYCRACSAIALSQTCAVSIHSAEFGEQHAGMGDVRNVGLPYRLVCEPGAPSHLSTCVHIPMFDVWGLARERWKGGQLPS